MDEHRARRPDDEELRRVLLLSSVFKERVTGGAFKVWIHGSVFKCTDFHCARQPGPCDCEMDVSGVLATRALDPLEISGARQAAGTSALARVVPVETGGGGALGLQRAVVALRFQALRRCGVRGAILVRVISR